LFSSSTARFGRVGQCDYAAANEYLNATARRLNRERPRCHTVALNWGPWDGGMVTPALRNMFVDEGVGLIPNDEGGQFLVAELSAFDRQPEVVVLGPPPNRPTQFTLSLDNVPPLGDHVLDGKAVLPVALAVNYLAEAAIRRFPDHCFIGCDRFRVLHPVQVPETGSISIHVHCDTATQRDDETVVPVQLEADGKTCYRAEVVLAALPTIDRHTVTSIGGAVADCYATELFHGRAWQGISNVVSCDQSGIDVVAHTAPAISSWIRDGSIRNWHADPMVIDCMLQAIIIHTQRQFGLPSLPVALGHIRLLDRINPGTVTINIRVTSTKLPMVRIDATVTDAAGRTIVEMTDCEHVCVESLRKAFANNRLAVGDRE
jgi:Polyketide synthase dehydratase/KR domain